MDTITKQQFEGGADLDGMGFGRFARRGPILAKRMEGEFAVETSEGAVTCEDGWLALDARGFPYPIPAAEFELGYAAFGQEGEHTIKDRIDGALAELLNRRSAAGQGDPAGREYSLAITALEEAKGWLARGLAHEEGVFTELDLQTQSGLEHARSLYETAVLGRRSDVGQPAGASS